MKIIIIILFSFITTHAWPQSGVEAFLNQVEEKNKELNSARQLFEAEKTGFQTGLAPDNPTIEYGYFPGNNDVIGTKTTFGISQSFDFPTVYQVKKKLANSQQKLSGYEYQLFRQDLLLRAKLRYYDYVFLLKRKIEYQSRLEHSDQLYQSYQTNFEKGNTSVLDVNKARIQNLKIKSNYMLLIQDIASVKKELELFSGGEFTDQISPKAPIDELTNLETILAESQQMQPELQYLKQAQKVAATKVKLSRQNWYPNLELAYEGESNPDGTYRGLRTGISIPLWKDKKSVRFAQAQSIYENTRYEARVEAILNETRKIYHQITELEKIRNEYQLTLDASTNLKFLDKALKLGQISVIEYFNELTFYYETIDSYWEIEKAYTQSLANLYAYKL